MGFWGSIPEFCDGIDLMLLFEYCLIHLPLSSYSQGVSFSVWKKFLSSSLTLINVPAEFELLLTKEALLSWFYWIYGSRYTVVFGINIELSWCSAGLLRKLRFPMNSGSYLRLSIMVSNYSLFSSNLYCY